MVAAETTKNAENTHIKGPGLLVSTPEVTTNECTTQGVKHDVMAMAAAAH
jgi:hypothetical protein